MARRRRNSDDEPSSARRTREIRPREATRTRDVAEPNGHVETARWWRVEGQRLAAAMWGWIDRLRMRQRAENLLDLVHEAIYEGRPLGNGLDMPAAAFLRKQQSAPANLNITRSMVDTVVAKLGKRRPMPCISADDAGWSEKLYAKRASRVLRRKMGQSIVERLCPQVLRDATIRGTGVAKVYRDGGDVAIERVPRYELVVDPREARYGTPRVCAQVKTIARDVAFELWPESKQQIAEASKAAREDWDPYDYDSPSDTDQIDVAEAWHLPSGPDADDGLHAICLRGHVLFVEPWKRPRFPLAFVHWSPPTRGFWGHGLVEDLTGIQAKVNDLARDVQEALYFGAMLKVFVQRGANIDKNHLRARHPVVIETDGATPNFVAPLPVSPQQIQFLQWLIQQAYEISGISQASAASKNPLGSNASGKALDTMYDLESDRFSHVEMQYAQFRVELGLLMLDEARAIAADEDAEDTAPWIEEVEWDTFDVDGGSYHLVLEPVNFLPDARSGKLSTVKEMADAGILSDPLQAASLFDEPDIARANRHLLGPQRRLEKWIEDLSRVDVPLEECVPTPYMLRIPGKAKEMLLGELDNAEAEDADDEVISRFRWACDMLKAAEEEIQAQQAPAAPPMPGVPPPAPGIDPMAGAPMMPPADPLALAGNGMGGLDAMAAAGMPLPGMAA